MSALEDALQEGDYTLACAMASTPDHWLRVENSMLKRLFLRPPSDARLCGVPLWCRCFCGPSAAFTEAIRRRDWSDALAHARNDDERRDAVTSVLRVREMCALEERGEIDAALELAILQSEVEQLLRRKAELQQAREAACARGQEWIDRSHLPGVVSFAQATGGLNSRDSLGRTFDRRLTSRESMPGQRRSWLGSVLSDEEGIAAAKAEK
ncbi:hypothetical protein AB1Y20_011973 [Prymnesium parvum]|uniref:Uncharacterized protein n=1 Tax=Prymnesium parvum TaxID=97485 RepID=A0AB34IPW4_PRYPA